ncbi:MAG TPA: vWA domain-containing protein [Rectinemataceae bacterium]|nr:vWA domain-containing protein [Rectinemataceae bacterium]
MSGKGRSSGRSGGRRAFRGGFWLVVVALFVVVAMPAIRGRAGGSAAGSAEGYTLQFGKDFRPGMNSVDDLGITIVLAIDVSGSMGDAPAQGGEAKYIQATRALRTIADYLDGLRSRQKDLVLRAAVLSFSTGVKTIMPLTTLDADGIGKLREIADNPDNFSPEGNTAIGSALEAGTELLAESGTILRSLIVVTDGENNRDPDPVEVMDAIYANRNSASRPELPVSTSTELVSFIGFDTDAGYFQPFEEKGARVTSAGDQAGLERSLKDLLEADVTKLEAPGLK